MRGGQDDCLRGVTRWDFEGAGDCAAAGGAVSELVVRQLNDIKTGNRNGMWAQLMKEVVAKLTVEDMVAIAAYTSSRQP